MAVVNVGSVLSLQGQWKSGPKFGKQFSVIKWEESLPASTYGIEKYLASGLIKVIGAAYARNIVERFGAETLQLMKKTPTACLK